MIYELLSTALLACSLGAGINKDGPMRASTTYPFLGQYELLIEHVGSGERQGDWYTIETPLGNTAVCHATAWDREFSATTSDGYATLWVTQRQGGTSNPYEADITIKLGAESSLNDLSVQRLDYSFGFMQEDQTYSLGENVEINEFNIEYTPEIYLYHDWGVVGTSTSTFTLPVTYFVEYDTFGTSTNNSIAWVKSLDRFEMTFTAIYEDNTEPKLYAFWLSSYYLARQVRYNRDIINLNYVTGMDRLDSLFGKQCRVSFTAQEDVYLKVSATPYDPSWELMDDYNRGYNVGYQDGKTEGSKPVSWIRTTFDGIAGFFNIQVFPFVTLGFLCFAPLIVVAIIAILRIIKHE